MTRKEKIFGFISSDEYKPMSIKEIMNILCVPKDERMELESILNELEAEGMIYKNLKNKYQPIEGSGFLKGTYYSKGKAYGFVVTDDGEKYFVNPSKVNGAYDKDLVLFKVTRKIKSSDKCSEGTVVKVISHGTQRITGTYNQGKNFGFVTPDNKSFHSDIYIAKKHCISEADGQKVVVKITKWPDKNENPSGVIEQILGFEYEKDVDLKCIMAQYGLNPEFPSKVELSAIAFGDRVYDEEIEGREDYRDHLIFTIDGEDARDFDDAVEIEKNAHGYRLGVHIADVTYYVSENCALDIEARKRGTSVYLPGFVVPMLPTHLSNGLCSLNPHCDRLALSVIMDFDSNGKIVAHKITQSVIQSKYRMTYDTVDDIIKGNKEKQEEYAELSDAIDTMNELRLKLKSNRMSKGGIDFDFPEVKITLDANGKAVDAYKAYSNDAQSLIEEFMLAANVCVAQQMYWSEIPFIYRIHEKPSPEKISAFAKFAAQFGFAYKGNRDNPHPGAFADMLSKIKGSSKELMISKFMLRSLMKAKYSEENLGHFGLSFEHYCHFTSPIRRYPDLAIHRIIKEHIKYGLTPNRHKFLEGFVKKAAKSSSEAEINAMEAEREAIDMKKAEYMSQKIGEKFHATISSVTSFGIFAETDFGIEGLISMRDLDDDYYEYDEKTLTLIGKRTSKTYAIGDELTIKVKRADSKCREIDFTIESGDNDE